jgi:hypothetical protein
MTNFLDIIHHLPLIKNTRRFGDWSPYLRRQGLALSIGPNRVGVLFLLDDGDRLQCPKRRVFFFIKDRRWIMSKKSVISATHHRHKPSEFTEKYLAFHFNIILTCSLHLLPEAGCTLVVSVTKLIVYVSHIPMRSTCPQLIIDLIAVGLYRLVPTT